MGECKLLIQNEELVFQHVDARFIEEIITQRCYEPSSEFEIHEDGIIIDLGANIGVFTLYAAQRASNRLVISVEPGQENFSLLGDNVNGCGMENIKFINAAVSDFTGETRLELSKQSGEGTCFTSKVRTKFLWVSEEKNLNTTCLLLFVLLFLSLWASIDGHLEESRVG